MKNLKHLLGYLIIIGLTFFVTKNYFCDPKGDTPPTITPEPVSCVIPECPENCKEPKAIIPLDKVGDMYYGFDNLVDRFNDQKAMDDQTLAELKKLLITRGIWFDYQEFKNYLSFIDKNAKDAGIAISGIRFFPGRYDQDDDKFGQLTLFYNPTYKTKNSAGLEDHYAYALERNGNDVRPILLEQLVPQLRKGGQAQQTEVNEGALFGSFTAFSNVRTFSQSGNHGQLNPPPGDL